MIAASAVRCTALAPHCNHIEDGDVKTYRLIPLVLAISVFLSGQFARAESSWLNDYKKAQEEAKASNKFLLLTSPVRTGAGGVSNSIERFCPNRNLKIMHATIWSS